MSENGLDTSGTAWISQGFENLVDRVRRAPQEVHFDILIVGSGYGGAMAARTFAGRQNNGQPISVALLERGKEYLPGSFPKGLSELPGHIRLDQNKEGLFDIRLGPEVTTVVANGLGGGSLINAGVMEVPTGEVFQTGWPEPLQKLSSLETFFDRARKMLGASNEEEKKYDSELRRRSAVKISRDRGRCPAWQFPPGCHYGRHGRHGELGARQP
jgi:cholesterol oxidase